MFLLDRLYYRVRQRSVYTGSVMKLRVRTHSCLLLVRHCEDGKKNDRFEYHHLCGNMRNKQDTVSRSKTGGRRLFRIHLHPQ